MARRLAHEHRTGITTQYNRKWSEENDIREFIQNALDGIAPLAPQGFVPFWPEKDNDKIIELRCKATGAILFRVSILHDSSSSMTVKLWQRMPEHEPKLSRAALYLYSDKRNKKGALGGFGEGLKICALQLLKRGYTCEYEMFQERWDFQLVSKPELRGAQELVVNIQELPQRTDPALIITVKGPRRDRIFVPGFFLAFRPKVFMFSSTQCDFIDTRAAEEKSAAMREKKVIFVNGICLGTDVTTISFFMNIRLGIDELSPDRDKLRVDSTKKITEALEEVLPTNETAQDVCLQIIEREQGRPRSDLKDLSRTARRAIVMSAVPRLYGDGAWPIGKDKPKQVRDVYTLLGKRPVELQCADFLLSGWWDPEEELAKLISRSPSAPVPPERAMDVAVLQRALAFINEQFRPHIMGFQPYDVKFVQFVTPFYEGVMPRSTVYLWAGLYDEAVCQEHFETPALFAWLSLLISSVVHHDRVSLWVPAKKRGHVSMQLMKLQHNPNTALVDQRQSLVSGLDASAVEAAGQGWAGGADQAQSGHTHSRGRGGGASGTDSAAGSGSGSGHDPAPPQQPPKRRGGNFAEDIDDDDVLERVRNALGLESNVGHHMAGDAKCSGNSVFVDVDDAIPPLNAHDLPFGVVYAEKDAFIPDHLGQRSLKVRQNVELMCQSVFNNLRVGRSVHYCYFPSDVVGFYDRKVNVIFVNLYFSALLHSPRALFLLLCHELSHLSGKRRHDTEFAKAMATLALDHSPAFFQLAAKLF